MLQKLARIVSNPVRIREHIGKKYYQLGDKYKIVGPTEIYDEKYYERRLLNAVREDTNYMGNMLIREFNPNSIIDIGCGVGNLLEPFLANGIKIKGIEGNPAAFEYAVVPKENLTQHDLREPYYPECEYDLAISIEVAEHLSKRFADTFVDTIARCSGTAVITAATPGQGGTHHVNEQPHEYWISKFEERNFLFDEQKTKIFRRELDLETRTNIPENILVFHQIPSD